MHVSRRTPTLSSSTIRLGTPSAKLQLPQCHPTSAAEFAATFTTIEYHSGTPQTHRRQE